MRSESTSALGQPSETKEIFGAALFSASAKGCIRSLVWVIFGRVCRFFRRTRRDFARNAMKRKGPPHGRSRIGLKSGLIMSAALGLYPAFLSKMGGCVPFTTH